MATAAEETRGWRKSLPAGVRPYSETAPIAALFLGISSGFPYAMIGATLTTRLKQGGIDKSTITAFTLVFLAYNFKFLWAWVMDGVRLPLLHTRQVEARGEIMHLVAKLPGAAEDGLAALPRAQPGGVPGQELLVCAAFAPVPREAPHVPRRLATGYQSLREAFAFGGRRQAARGAPHEDVANREIFPEVQARAKGRRHIPMARHFRAKFRLRIKGRQRFAA